MKFQRIIIVVLVAVFTLSACSTETKKTSEVKVAKIPKLEKIAIDISGMTCKIGCAKTIQSKLSKKAGITSAKVIFKDSLGLVEYDANTISAEGINTFINGIAGGDLYTVKSSKQVVNFDEIQK
ncbi:MAG: mercuric ion binding protein [Polaribacter sp.]|jgi:mercuric ion binding protein